jgi:Uma2 family endonuclease
MVIDALQTVIRADHVLGPPQGGWTYEAYAALPDDGLRYEIIDGVLYMAPAPLPDHENIVMLLGARLVITIEDTGLGRVFASPDVDLGSIVVRPDAVVVLANNPALIDRRKITGAPDLIIEIASPSTAAYDRDTTLGKQGAYARAGIPEYWIADPATRTIEVLVLAEGVYEMFGVFASGDVLRSNVLSDLAVPVERCFPRATA